MRKGPTVIDVVKPTRVATLSQQVADELQARIVAGDWPVGHKIPTEPELVQALGVSRSTVREAVRSLIHVRMLEARPGDGTYVCSASPLKFPMQDRISHASLREAIEVRAMLQQRIARLAAARCTPADAERLRELLTTAGPQLANAQSYDECAPAIMAFNTAISDLTGNRLLVELDNHVTTATVAKPPFPDHWSPEIGARVLGRLTDLIDAICAGNPDEAEQSMRRAQREILPLVADTGDAQM
ncbi:FadR family transcriptional regulator [Nocardia cyriacigeorgica]|uniref:FadR family transcriptional regulator n=1 Tax=Nocardia cyriacigeorgica TaxID=135487 RepID=A0A5R8P818_9NOCA|nr:FadR family transcriptional regulator [Nocardia cyriacigeorgica]